MTTPFRRVIIAGSRTLSPSVDDISAAIANLDQEFWQPNLWGIIVCGMARGVDMSGAAWARTRGLIVEEYPVTPSMYAEHGKYLAPKMRNRQMAMHADAAILFWDGTSGGTADMCMRMVARGRPVVVIPLATTKRRAK